MSRYLNTDETICAPATPPGRGGIAVVRVSGPQSLEISKFVAKNLADKNIRPRHCYFTAFYESHSAEPFDDGLFVYFISGSSYTGQDVVEFSVHGSPIIVQKLLSELIARGARLAEPGEFTYRAYSAGRMDLIQAESVRNLIDSTSAAQARWARRHLMGEFSQSLNKLKDDLILSLAHIEASIDFGHEDIVVEPEEATRERLQRCRHFLSQLVSTESIGRRVQQGLKVCLAGEPNVGKSSLFNRLLKYDRAIVSDIPGTTRDSVEGDIVFKGHLITFVDTAGLRVATDKIERLGIERSKQAIHEADVILYVTTREQGDQALTFNDKPIYRIYNKCDLYFEKRPNKTPYNKNDKNPRSFDVSALLGEGLEAVLEALYDDFLKEIDLEKNEIVFSVRHLTHLKNAEAHIVRALEQIQNKVSSEYLAFELQSALYSIYEILGERYDDQVMDKVFNQFCLGK